MKVTVAVVGLGKMGLLHASILSVMDNVELVALCEKSSLIRRFGRKIIPSVNLVDDIQKLSSMGLDAVFVTTPEFSHSPIIKAIYNDSIANNIFVEKPLASSYAAAVEVCELANSQSGINMVGYNRRFSVTFRKAKQILDEGVLIEPAFFKAHAFSSDFFGAKLNTKTSSRGGVLSDLGCHAIDLALWFFGQLYVTDTNLGPYNSGTPEDLVHFKVKTLDGLSPIEGEFRCSRCMENYRLPEIGLRIQGSNGNLMVDEDKIVLKLNDGYSSIWYKHDLDDNTSFFIGGTEYVREDEYFINSILEGCTVEPNFQTASRIEQIIDVVKTVDEGDGTK